MRGNRKILSSRRGEGEIGWYTVCKKGVDAITRVAAEAQPS
jgi:hypothetical protein